MVCPGYIWPSDLELYMGRDVIELGILLFFCLTVKLILKNRVERK